MILSLMEKCINKYVLMLWGYALVQILHPSMSLNGKRLLFKVNLANLLFYISDIWMIYLLFGHTLKRNSGTNLKY